MTIIDQRTDTQISHIILQSRNIETYLLFEPYSDTGEKMWSNKKIGNVITSSIWRSKSKKILCRKIKQVNISRNPVATLGMWTSTINRRCWLVVFNNDDIVVDINSSSGFYSILIKDNDKDITDTHTHARNIYQNFMN